jgi:transmembrane sensor
MTSHKHSSRVHARSPSHDARAQAERWYARLKAPDCTAAERIEFERWRTTPEHAAAYQATTKLWQSFDQLAKRPELEQLSRRILADTAERPQRRFFIKVQIAAAVLIALICGGLFLSQHREPPAAVYVTHPGESRKVWLADGSQLILNYATEVEVRLGRDARTLTLRKGEALFIVAHDETRPFRVTAGDGEVTALGTRFEVRSDAEHVEVTLLEGRIAVERRAAMEHILLVPGDQVRFAAATPEMTSAATPEKTVAATLEMTRRIVDPEVVASWSTGRLRFRSTPLNEALEQVNRYSTTQIRIADPSLTQIPISGTFQIGDSASIVAALESLFLIQATKSQDGEIILRGR